MIPDDKGLATNTSSKIGTGFLDAPKKAWLAMVLCTLVLGYDLAASFHYEVVTDDIRRFVFAIIVLLFYASLSNWNWHSLGVRFRPKEGIFYWVKVSVVIGCLVLGFAFLVWLFWTLFIGEIDLKANVISPEEIEERLLYACVVAPVTEELLYRGVLCVPLMVLFGKVPTIILSGIIFGGLHFIYGNPGPDNFIAGYFFAWVLIKSETLWLPVVLHSLGNLFVVLINFAIFFW